MTILVLELGFESSKGCYWSALIGRENKQRQNAKVGAVAKHLLSTGYYGILWRANEGVK